MQLSVHVILYILLFYVQYAFLSPTAKSVFQFTEEARAALCPFVGTTGMRCFAGSPLQRSGRNFDSEFRKLPLGVGISVDRSTGRLMAPAVQLTYSPEGSRTWTDGLTGVVFDLFNEARLGSADRVAAAYDTARVHIFHNASHLDAAWRQTFADGKVRGGELARRPEMVEYFENREEALALSQRVIGLYTLTINASAVKLNEFARRALSQLTATFDSDLYGDFLNTWGTHIITRSLVGGMIEEKAKVVRCSRVSDDARFAHCIPFGDRGSISSNCKYYSDQMRLISKRRLGGNVEIENDNEWKRTLAVGPALLQILEMVPWYDFVTDNSVKQNLIAIMQYRQTHFDVIQAESARLVDARLQPCVSGAETVINSLFGSLIISYPILRPCYMNSTDFFLENDSLHTISAPMCSAHINANSIWKKNGVTVAGGSGPGSGMNQLHHPCGLFVDNDQTIYIAEWDNNRVVEWKSGVPCVRIVAGGNGQLKNPTDVIVDKARNSIFICDYGNKRVLRWSLKNANIGETIMSELVCLGLTMDEQGFLYVADEERNEVRRWQVGETQGILVAGGNGAGNRLNQLIAPRRVFVDHVQSVYVADQGNDRVMKWVKGAKEGIVVAGGRGRGNLLSQLNFPDGIIVDQLETVYVSDLLNHRIMRWPKGATEGQILVGEHGKGSLPNQVDRPNGLSFDRHGNLYVADDWNHRVQKFEIQ
ncbi:unnamed protein product [Rotaria magnacalcarata]|uniref:MACPF domain-containing protein n=1 Tax=Rotaria magnacalcarata TaxID=392030 RepID=A0A8S2NCC7_9BILA|nr:unnamed protein product [Rotaria magnacalcarata]CAF4025246.1 unnamed protein product [Rotaria magnacalcarata]CAF4033668.1 unnamed protein product [Rotaria magnacalcarata]